jgi:hypothetical protein
MWTSETLSPGPMSRIPLELPKSSAQAISAELAKCSSSRQAVQAARKAGQMTGETS